MNQKQLETLQKNNAESRDFVKSCFRFALMIILKNKEDKTLTITRLCHIAGVSRTAFYRNYNSVDDVLEDEIKTFWLTLAGQIGTDVYENWLAFFKLVEKKREDLVAVLDAGFEQKFADVYRSLLPENEENRFIQTIWLSCFLSLMVKWIKVPKPKKPEEMARLAYKLTKDIPLAAE